MKRKQQQVVQKVTGTNDSNKSTNTTTTITQQDNPTINIKKRKKQIEQLEEQELENQEMKFVAFFRGINIGGRNIIKNDSLCKLFKSTINNCTFVKGHLQSGNILFKINNKNKNIDIDSLITEIEIEITKKLKEEHKIETTTFIRSLNDLQNIIKKSSSFINIKNSQLEEEEKQEKKDSKYFITFLSNKIEMTNDFIIKRKKKDNMIWYNLSEIDIFSKSLNENDKYGSPNNIIEKELNVIGTTRYLNVIEKIVTLLK
ncbi:hypothetical protein ABK040_015825 [Willaertia magna]